MIRIGEILDPSCVLMGLSGGGRAEVLRVMTDRLAELGRIDDSATIHRLLMDRESLMTTAVRRGFAFPHAFNEKIERSFLTVGAAPGGVDFAALDGEPVNFIFLLLGPPDNQAIHLRILARISRLTGQPEVLQLMREAADREALLETIANSEQQLKANPYALPDVRE